MKKKIIPRFQTFHIGKIDHSTYLKQFHKFMENAAQ